ncbi:glycosyltransferase family 2 protein [Gaetbulibacter sp. NE]|uniref:glycosyltransferase family 2 protein n=1 Tax=Gaetbulibacter sp. NE TaxID=2982307 RepID=UPI0021D1D5D9|nr:glycosyltransferase family A protein [Gaetbulibacter sp. NE]
MEKQQLISIIIPTYNRAHLIGATLDSIAAQSYAGWECLVIDDGSTDDTAAVVGGYEAADARFQYHERPVDKPKGANACRNYGLDLAHGQYVVFFDSDDLMTPNHLEVKHEAILKHECDFVITQTRYFNNDALNRVLERQYAYESSDISLYNFVTHKTVWLTLDVCIKKNIAKTIEFNEQLQSGQEYNYFSKLLCESVNCIYLKDVLSQRRHHESSIRGGLRTDAIKTSIGFYKTYWYTFQDLKDTAPNIVLQFLLYRCYRLSLKIPKAERPFRADLLKAMRRYMGLKGYGYGMHLQLRS